MHSDRSCWKIPGCLSVCLSVCLCVCASVCLSLHVRTPKVLGQFQWNFPQMVPYMSSYARLSFSSLTYLMMSRPPSLTKKRGHCHNHSLYPIFLKFGMWVVLLFTNFGIVTQSFLLNQIPLEIRDDKVNKNAMALRVHSVIYWSLSINGHRIFRCNMYQMHKIPLFSIFADQIWTHLLIFKHSYTTSGFGGHIGILKKTVILSLFWHQLHVFRFFSCWGGLM